MFYRGTFFDSQTLPQVADRHPVESISDFFVLDLGRTRKIDLHFANPFPNFTGVKTAKFSLSFPPQLSL